MDKPNWEKFVFIVHTETFAPVYYNLFACCVADEELDIGLSDGDLDLLTKMWSEFTEEQKLISLDIRCNFVVAPGEGNIGEHADFCTYCSTQGWFNDTLGGVFQDGQEKEALDHFQKQCAEYAQRTNLQEDKNRWKEFAAKPLQKAPAYLSMAFYFRRQPTGNEIAEIIRRLKLAATAKEVKITGFVLLKEKPAYEEINSFPA
jgi:hypothetical protein